MTEPKPNYSEGNSRFNDEAKMWDSKPEVVKSSQYCLASLLESASRYVPQGLSSCAVLEIGCGTGLLTVPLAQHVKSILALDTALGMIEMLKAKVEKQGLVERVRAEVKLLEDPKDTVLAAEKFDLVVSHLVMHHVPNMLDLLKVMHGTLKQNGRVWISDFEDDGPRAQAFHPKDKHAGVERHGLKRTEMKSILKDAGFSDVQVFTSFSIEKEVDDGSLQTFPFLAVTGIKS
ncbi:related to phosphoethanolamine N-methyltransferase [Melanopsichium pennsylvanicum]|uniref:Related to phosphoethanolamine N-methyltransferase n=2 Tax=Melanopsichium pennsylvanicum TaxID=63383 RepID=A0AAJ4XSZ2_9BASI|nr:s-adenosyl-l-methionine-dependent methyltransferase [Melanopsichium pennsylvanicum 4]SNX87431.1 related to phosphoethanolamine N-methyltransferase [Melanopsichium pennsylvanicum]